MREPKENIYYVCPNHAPKPGKYMDSDRLDFIGSHVKTSFVADDKRLEHMWVRIERIDEDFDDGLIGKLDNDPVFATQYQHGQTVKVRLWEIEDVL